jgi:hypothetical protein
MMMGSHELTAEPARHIHARRFTDPQIGVSHDADRRCLERDGRVVMDLLGRETENLAWKDDLGQLAPAILHVQLNGDATRKKFVETTGAVAAPVDDIMTFKVSLMYCFRCRNEDIGRQELLFHRGASLGWHRDVPAWLQLLSIVEMGCLGEDVIGANA